MTLRRFGRAYGFRLLGWHRAAVLIAALCAVFAFTPLSEAQEPGQAVVFSTDEGSPGNMQIAVMQRDGSDFNLLTPAPPESLAGASFSPDAQRIAFATEDGVWVSRPDGSDARRLSTVQDDDRVAPLWSPDGTKLEVPGSDGVAILDVATGHVRLLASASGLGAWSPDSRRLATAGRGRTRGLWAYSAVDGTRRLLSGVRENEIVQPGSVSWSRNGKWIAYSVEAGNRLLPDVRAVASNGTGDHLVARGFGSPSISPDGTRVVMAKSDGQFLSGIWIAPTAGALPRHLATGSAYAWTSDGRALVMVNGRQPYLVRLPGGAVVPLTATTWPRRIHGAQWWAPDGSGVLLGGASMQLLRRTGERRLLFRSRDDVGPVVSPDGRIAFVRLATGVYERSVRVVVIRADGRGLIDLGPGEGPRWSKDGTLAFRSAGGEIVVVTRDGKRRATGLKADTLAWSPDGSELAYGIGGELWRARTDGSRRRLIVRLGKARCSGEDGTADVVTRIDWSPDGRRLGIVDGLYCDSTTRLIDLDGTHVRTLEEYFDGGGFSWSPDGSRLAYASDTLFLADGDGSHAQAMTDADGQKIPATQVAWSPDGSVILIDSGYSGIWIVDPDGGDPVVIGPHAQKGDPAWG